MSNSNKYLLSFASIAILLIVVKYFFSNPQADIDLVNRGLESPLKLWLNGHLGFLFNIEFVGLVPLAGSIFLFRKQILNLPVFQLVNILWIFVMAVFIALVGFINYRYLCTLIPLFLLSMAFRENLDKQLLKALLIVQVLVFSYSLVFHFLKNYSSRITQMLIVEEKPNFKVPDIYQYINDNLYTTDKVLVNNMPEFYLKSKVKGVFYWSGDDVYYVEKGPHPLQKGRSNQETIRFITDSLQCSYILTHNQLMDYNDSLRVILEDHFYLKTMDKKGALLFKIKTNNYFD
jgi:hypothetical protein